jgi:hypothetical protein
MTRPLRIANASGFFGDRHSAPREMVEGGPIDVLTGDYLAELTMAILLRKRLADPDAGYAQTFLTQMEDVLGTCVQRGIKVVANAGGLNPLGLADALATLAARQRLSVRVATVAGDDLMPQLATMADSLTNAATGERLDERGLTPATANAYLGGWGIAAALDRGADVVVTGRVADASLLVGAAAWHHGWARDEWDALAGAVVAGHVIECGAQATGGNYSFFSEIPDLAKAGFPLAEVAADGSCVITKHPGTGGLVSQGTVTAQLLYEIGSPAYLNPDVTAHLDTVQLADDGYDRVRIEGVRGSPPPATTKVSATALGGYRNQVTFVLTGLDIEAKVDVALAGLWERVGGRERFDEVDVRLIRTDRDDPPSNEQAMAYLQVTVTDGDATRVGRAFSNAAVELALAGYPGFALTAPPSRESPLLVYWPSAVPQLESIVTIDGETFKVPAAPHGPPPKEAMAADDEGDGDLHAGEPTLEAPLGRIIGARSGDKGGDANIGIWARSDASFGWVRAYLTVERLRSMIPETADLAVERYELANLRALNFVVRGLLGDGVASSTRWDPQAKGLGEYLRARVVPIPETLLAV